MRPFAEPPTYEETLEDMQSSLQYVKPAIAKNPRHPVFRRKTIRDTEAMIEKHRTFIIGYGRKYNKESRFSRQCVRKYTQDEKLPHSLSDKEVQVVDHLSNEKDILPPLSKTFRKKVSFEKRWHALKRKTLVSVAKKQTNLDKPYIHFAGSKTLTLAQALRFEINEMLVPEYNTRQFRRLLAKIRVAPLWNSRKGKYYTQTGNDVLTDNWLKWLKTNVLYYDTYNCTREQLDYVFNIIAYGIYYNRSTYVGRGTPVQMLHPFGSLYKDRKLFQPPVIALPKPKFIEQLATKRGLLAWYINNHRHTEQSRMEALQLEHTQVKQMDEIIDRINSIPVPRQWYEWVRFNARRKVGKMFKRDFQLDFTNAFDNTTDIHEINTYFCQMYSCFYQLKITDLIDRADREDLYVPPEHIYHHPIDTPQSLGNFFSKTSMELLGAAIWKLLKDHWHVLIPSAGLVVSFFSQVYMLTKLLLRKTIPKDEVVLMVGSIIGVLSAIIPITVVPLANVYNQMKDYFTDIITFVNQHKPEEDEISVLHPGQDDVDKWVANSAQTTKKLEQYRKEHSRAQAYLAKQFKKKIGTSDFDSDPTYVDAKKQLDEEHQRRIRKLGVRKSSSSLDSDDMREILHVPEEIENKGKEDEPQSSKMPKVIAKAFAMGVIGLAKVAGTEVPSNILHQASTMKKDLDVLTTGVDEFLFDTFGIDTTGESQLKTIQQDLIEEGNAIKQIKQNAIRREDVTRIKKWCDLVIQLSRLQKEMCTPILHALYIEVSAILTTVLSNHSIDTRRPVPVNIMFYGPPGQGKTRFMDWLDKQLCMKNGWPVNGLFNLNTGPHYNGISGQVGAEWDEFNASVTASSDEVSKSATLNNLLTGGHCVLPTAGLVGKEQFAQFKYIFFATNREPTNLNLMLNEQSMEAFKSRFVFVEVIHPEMTAEYMNVHGRVRTHDDPHHEELVLKTTRGDCTTLVHGPNGKPITNAKELLIYIDHQIAKNQRHYESFACPEPYNWASYEEPQGLTDKPFVYIYGPPGVGKTDTFLSRISRVSVLLGKKLSDRLADPEPNTIYVQDDPLINDKEYQQELLSFYNSMPASSAIIVISNYTPYDTWYQKFAGKYTPVFYHEPGLRRRFTSNSLSQVLEMTTEHIYNWSDKKVWDEGQFMSLMGCSGRTFTHVHRCPYPNEEPAEYVDLNMTIGEETVIGYTKARMTATMSKRVKKLWNIITKLKYAENPVPTILNCIDTHYKDVDDLKIRVVSPRGTIHIIGKKLYAVETEIQYRLQDKDGELVVIDPAGTEVTITDEAVQAVYASDYSNASVPAQLAYIIGTWKVTGGDEWKRIREKFPPKIHVNVIEEYRTSKLERVKKWVAVGGVTIAAAIGLIGTIYGLYQFFKKDVKVLTNEELALRVTQPRATEIQIDEAQKLASVKNPVKLRYGGKTYTSTSSGDATETERLRKEMTKKILAKDFYYQDDRYHVDFVYEGKEMKATYKPGTGWDVCQIEVPQSAPMYNTIQHKHFRRITSQLIRLEGISMATCITPTLFVVPYHCVKDKIFLTITCDEAEELSGKIILKEETWELAVGVILKGNKPFPIPGFRDLTKCLLTEEDQKKVRVCTIPLQDSAGTTFKNYDYEYCQTVGPTATQNLGPIQTMQNWTKGIGHAIYGKTAAVTKRGDCGIPYLAESNINSDVPTAHILGVHAVDRSTGVAMCCAVLTVERWNAMASALEVPHCLEPVPFPHTTSPKPVDIFYPKEMTNILRMLEEDEVPEFQPHGPNFKAIATLYNNNNPDANVSKMKIPIEGPIVQAFPPDLKVPVLTRKQIEEHHADKIFPDKSGNKHAWYVRMFSGERNVMSPQSDIDRLHSKATQLGKFWATKFGKKLKILSVEEVLNGTEQLTPLKLNTSSSTAVQLLFPKCTQKKDFFTDTEPRTFRETTEGQWMKKLIDEQWLYAQSGKMLCLPTTVALKAEMLKKGKEWKKRVYYVVPMALVINMRRFMGPIQAAFAKFGSDSPFQVQLNVFCDWHPLISNLLETGDTFMDIDFSSYDITVPYAAITAVTNFCVPFFAKTGTEKREYARLFHSYFHTIAVTNLIVERTLISKQGGIPSGIYGTSMVDGIALYVMLYDMFCKLVEGGVADFVSHINVKTCGDDCLISLSKEMSGHLDFDVVTKYFATLGMSATPSTKDDRKRKHTPIEDITFVSCYTKKLPGYNVWIPKLKDESISSSLHWTSYSLPANIYEGLLNMRIQMMYSEEHYDMLQDAIAIYARKNGIKFFPLPYEDAKRALYMDIHSMHTTTPDFNEILNHKFTQSIKPKKLEYNMESKIKNMTDQEFESYLQIMSTKENPTEKRIFGKLTINMVPSNANLERLNLAEPRRYNLETLLTALPADKITPWQVFWAVPLETLIEKLGIRKTRNLLQNESTNLIGDMTVLLEEKEEPQSLSGANASAGIQTAMSKAPGGAPPPSSFTTNGQATAPLAMPILGADGSFMAWTGYIADFKDEAYFLQDIDSLKIPTGTTEDTTIKVWDLSAWNPELLPQQAHRFADMHESGIYGIIMKAQVLSSSTFNGSISFYFVPTIQTRIHGPGNFRYKAIAAHEIARLSFGSPEGEETFVVRPTLEKELNFTRTSFLANKDKPWTDKSKISPGAIVVKATTPLNATLPTQSAATIKISVCFTPETKFKDVIPPTASTLNSGPPRLDVVGTNIMYDSREIPPPHVVTRDLPRYGTNSSILVIDKADGRAWQFRSENGGTGSKVVDSKHKPRLLLGNTEVVQKVNDSIQFNGFYSDGEANMRSNVPLPGTQSSLAPANDQNNQYVLDLGHQETIYASQKDKLAYTGVELLDNSREKELTIIKENDKAFGSKDPPVVKIEPDQKQLEVYVDRDSLVRNEDGYQHFTITQEVKTTVTGKQVPEDDDYKQQLWDCYAQFDVNPTGAPKCVSGIRRGVQAPGGWAQVKFHTNEAVTPTVSPNAVGETTWFSSRHLAAFKTATVWCRENASSFVMEVSESGQMVARILANRHGFWAKTDELYSLRQTPISSNVQINEQVYSEDWPNLPKFDGLNFISRKSNAMENISKTMDGNWKIRNLYELLEKRIKDKPQATVLAGVASLLTGVGSSMQSAAEMKNNNEQREKDRKLAVELQSNRLSTMAKISQQNMATTLRNTQLQGMNQTRLSDMNFKNSLKLKEFDAGVKAHAQMASTTLSRNGLGFALDEERDPEFAPPYANQTHSGMFTEGMNFAQGVQDMLNRNNAAARNNVRNAGYSNLRNEAATDEHLGDETNNNSPDQGSQDENKS